MTSVPPAFKCGDDIAVCSHRVEVLHPAMAPELPFRIAAEFLVQGWTEPDAEARALGGR